MLHAAKQTVEQTNAMSPAEAEQQASLQVALTIEQTNARLATSAANLALVCSIVYADVMQLAAQRWLLP